MNKLKIGMYFVLVRKKNLICENYSENIPNHIHKTKMKKMKYTISYIGCKYFYYINSLI